MKLWPFWVRPEMCLGHSPVSLIVACGDLGKEPGEYCDIFCTYFPYLWLGIFTARRLDLFLFSESSGDLSSVHFHMDFLNTFYSSHFLICRRNSSLSLKTLGIRKSRFLTFFQNSRLVHLTAIIAISYYKNYVYIHFKKYLFLIESPFAFVCPHVETQRGLQLMKTLQPTLKLAASECLEMTGRCTDLRGLLSLLLPSWHCFQYPASQMKAAPAVCSSHSHTSRLQYRHTLCLRVLLYMSSSSFNKFAVKY